MVRFRARRAAGDPPEPHPRRALRRRGSRRRDRQPADPPQCDVGRWVLGLRTCLTEGLIPLSEPPLRSNPAANSRSRLATARPHVGNSSSVDREIASQHGITNIGRRSSETAVALPRSGSADSVGLPQFRGSAVSRTDAHAPFHVRLARGEVAVHPVHRCTGPETCDLPDLVPGWADTAHRCHWQWFFTGQDVCSCWMCHWPKRRQPRRSGRGSSRVQLRGLARSWNAGDSEAGDRM